MLAAHFKSKSRTWSFSPYLNTTRTKGGAWWLGRYRSRTVHRRCGVDALLAKLGGQDHSNRTWGARVQNNRKLGPVKPGQIGGGGLAQLEGSKLLVGGYGGAGVGGYLTLSWSGCN